ncbi:MAG: MarR family transcriptional regulator [Candidatus Kapaibacterium sp.]|nr:MAG: MarR family transcriptional regulator [Candidatus Kapabacteria bacterium]
MEAILSVRRAARAIDDVVEAACSRLGITGVQYNILRILGRAPAEGISRSQIVSQLIEQHADVTRAIDGLVAAGYVEREHATHDRRVVLHRITQQGRSAIEQLDPFLRSALEQMTQHFTTDELQTLAQLSSRFPEAASTAQQETSPQRGTHERS